MNRYQLIADSPAAAFLGSRAKIRLYGGGFANGKTTALVIDALQVAKDYPGASMMLGRATHANLMKTVWREFFKWCPPNWVKGSNKQDGTVTLINGTIIDFRYVSDQSSTSAAESTSNLLSANYDYIGIDQIDDVEITHHDFQQMLGRLRGQTPYAGDDPTQPQTGPRLLALTCNPTLGWPYKTIVKPIHDLRSNRFNPELLCERDPDTQEPVLGADGMPKPIVEVYEATTYDNAQNLTPDYIRTLESTYTGKMRDRYLLGKWVAFDGVVYDEFDSNVHMVPQEDMLNHLDTQRIEGFELTLLEAYDDGVTEPSCYLLSLIDGAGIIYVVDGYYEPNRGIAWKAEEIRRLRQKHAGPELVTMLYEPEPYADPAIFRRSPGRTIGKSVADMFKDEGITMRRGANAIEAGIIRVKGHLMKRISQVNPFTGALGCPSIFFADHMFWLSDEMTSYRWKKQRDETQLDKPVDGKDHAMDTVKYLTSQAARPARLGARKRSWTPPQAVLQWGEKDTTREPRSAHRYR